MLPPRFFGTNPLGISISFSPEFPFWIPGSPSILSIVFVVGGNLRGNLRGFSFLSSRAAPKGAKEYFRASSVHRKTRIRRIASDLSHTSPPPFLQPVYFFASIYPVATRSEEHTSEFQSRQY